MTGFFSAARGLPKEQHKPPVDVWPAVFHATLTTERPRRGTVTPASSTPCLATVQYFLQARPGRSGSVSLSQGGSACRRADA